MSEKTFVGICLSSGSGTEHKKIFQSGCTRVLVDITGIPAKIGNALVRGGTYIVSYLTEYVDRKEGNDISRDDTYVCKANIERISAR